MINLDTVTGVAFIAQNSLVRYILRQYVNEQETADAKAVRAAYAQGVNFNVYIHAPFPLTGN